MAGRRTPSTPQSDGHGTQMPRKRATTIVPDGRLVLSASAANSRLFVYMIGNYVHRLERERRELYFGDLDLARVAEIIGRRASSRACVRGLPRRARSAQRRGLGQAP